ncbi:MAG: hypothetical protein HY791_23810 [Deltaproteobacteria bacterium]|nr:hypothetical protein [Deltaproteobacteria bacterium]
MRVPVKFTFRAEPHARVEVLGDFPSFKVAHSMRELRPGEYEAELLLQAGVYRYKYRIDGSSWRHDPSKPSEHVDGYVNNVVVVAGTEPPLYFAPDQRHLAYQVDGSVEVFAECDVTANGPAEIWVEDEAEAIRRAPLEGVATHRGRHLLRARLQGRGSAPRSMGFVGLPTRVYALDGPDPSVAPSWLRGAVFYGIFVDRWFRGKQSVPDPRAAPRSSLSSGATFYGGDLDGITESISSISSLGVTALVLTPLNPSPSPHRYDSIDLHSIDPRIGGEDGLRRLVEAAHRARLKVVVDASFTHVHETHPAFVDLLAKKRASVFKDWFQVLSMPVRRRDPTTYRHYPGGPGLPLLDLQNASVRAHVLEAAERWVDRGVDGLRLDAMDEVPSSLWRELRSRVRDKSSQFLLLGEVVTDRHHGFTGANGADVATDFVFRDLLVDFFAKDRIDAEELWARMTFLEHRLGPKARGARLLFLDNHDTPRFRSIAISHDRHRLALAFLLFMPEPVWLTYGAELGLAGGSPESRREDVWTERLPMPDPSSPRTRSLVRDLLGLRQRLDTTNGLRPIALSRGFLAMARSTATKRKSRTDEVILLVNRGPTDRRVDDLIPSHASTLLEVNGRQGPADAPLAPMTGRLISVNGAD